MGSIAQGWFVLTVTNSPFWLGAVAAAGQVPFLAFSLAGGTLADRFDRRRLIAAGNAILCVLALLCGILITKGAMTLAALTALAFAIGTIVALEHPIDRAWVYDLIEGRLIGTATALSALEWSVARMLGPAIGGIAIAATGVASGYYTFALAVIPMAVLPLVLGARGSGARHTSEDERGAAESSAANRKIVVFSIFVGTFTLSVMPYISLLPDIARNALHLDARGYGLLAACGGIGSMIGALGLGIAGELRRKGRIVPIAAVGGALLLALFARTSSVPVAAILLVLMGAVDTMMYALANTYVQECASDAERGRANAVFSLAFVGAIPIGNVILGALAGRFGTGEALEAGAASACAGAIAFWFAAPQAREAA
jgi:MFS family permease